jgi:hypothetical protein
MLKFEYIFKCAILAEFNNNIHWLNINVLSTDYWTKSSEVMWILRSPSYMSIRVWSMQKITFLEFNCFLRRKKLVDGLHPHLSVIQHFKSCQSISHWEVWANQPRHNETCILLVSEQHNESLTCIFRRLERISALLTPHQNQWLLVNVRTARIKNFPRRNTVIHVHGNEIRHYRFTVKCSNLARTSQVICIISVNKVL